MGRYVALLRAINVGGRQQVAMSALRELAESLGLGDASTLLQSGNLLFTSASRSSAALETLLERETERALGVRCDYHVRSAAEWGAVVAGNPFADEAERDPAHLLVLTLKTKVDPSRVEALQRAIRGPEQVRGTGRALYFVYPDGVGRSTLTNAIIERQLGAAGTARNWNTVLKIAGLLGQG